MPIYTYQCPSCSNKFELRQGWDAENVAPCPLCQAEAKRVLLAPSVIFKGRGWYSTDSKRSSHASMVGSNGDSSSSSETSSASSESSTESKAATSSTD